jgi:hypothetical protein
MKEKLLGALHSHSDPADSFGLDLAIALHTSQWMDILLVMRASDKRDKICQTKRKTLSI